MFKGTMVKELTPSDYQNGAFQKAKGQKGLVAIVADWCGHCKALKPIYAKVANAHGKAFPLYYVDAVKYQDFTSNQLNVSGFPTIKVLDTNGKPYKDYSGERSFNAIMAFICKEGRVCKRI